MEPTRIHPCDFYSKRSGGARQCIANFRGEHGAAAAIRTGKMTSTARIVGLLCVVLAAGCTAVKEAPPRVIAQSAPLKVDPALAGAGQEKASQAAAPQEAAASPAQHAAEPSRPATTGDMVGAGEPAAVAGAPPSASQGAAKAAPPPAKAPAKAAAAPVAVEQPRKSEELPPVAKKQESSLDLAALKERLRETKAIGVFTKLALKNQVDDLLAQFRAHYASGQNTLAALRQQYDMLVLKVLALLQDSDPPLARTIAGSREAIWGILADPVKFNSAS